MNFLIPGKNPQLSEIELKNLFKISKIDKHNNYWTINQEIIDNLENYPLAGFLKYGKILNKNEIESFLGKNPTKLIATNDINWAKKLKKAGLIKNFKILNSIFHSILEVKNKGLEILKFDTNTFGITQRFQPIKVYETIDFQKPVRGMKKGMMPTKLTHLLINIGIGQLKDTKNIFIYDPFVGFGTTGFVANFLNINFIGSDINTSPAKQNFKRRQTTKYFKHIFFDIFKHDVQNPFKKNLLKKVNLIVSEGFLGPVIKNKQMLQNIAFLENQILPIYTAFFNNVDKFWNQITGIITIPDYISDEKISEIKPKNLNFQILTEIYKRKNQFVGRKIILFHK